MKNLSNLILAIFATGLFVLLFSLYFFSLVDKEDILQGVHSDTLQVEVIENDNSKTINYKNDQGEITYANDLCYATIVYFYDDSGRIDSQFYYDSDGNPTPQKAGNYGLAYTYLSDSQYRITYLDKNGFPIENSSGYVSSLCTVNESNQVICEQYLDANNNSVILITGQSGSVFEYDGLNRLSKITFVDQNGDPIVCRRGYSSILKCYDDNGVLVEEYYLDATGGNVSLEHGQYGIRYVNGKTIYLDENGRAFFNLDNWINNNLIVVPIFITIFCILFWFFYRYSGIFLVVSVILIIFETLLFRHIGETRQILVRPLWSYSDLISNRITRFEVLNNICLFIPFGLSIVGVLDKYLVNKKVCKAIIITVFFSFLIEILQFIGALGTSEIDDIISNCIGSGLGIFLYFSISKLHVIRGKYV